MGMLEQATLEALEGIGLRVQQAFDDALQEMASELGVPRVRIRSKLTGRPAFGLRGKSDSYTPGEEDWLQARARCSPEPIDEPQARKITEALAPLVKPRPEPEPDDIDQVSLTDPTFGVSKRRSPRRGLVRHRIAKIERHAATGRQAVTWLCGNYTFSAKVGDRDTFKGVRPCDRCEEAHRKASKRRKAK